MIPDNVRIARSYSFGDVALQLDQPVNLPLKSDAFPPEFVKDEGVVARNLLSAQLLVLVDYEHVAIRADSVPVEYASRSCASN